MPKRIQRKRTKGYKLSPNCIYVGRPTIWGNPWPVGGYSVEESLLRYEQYARWMLKINPKWLEPLMGRDICCWCKDSEKCHGDILLRLLAEKT